MADHRNSFIESIAPGKSFLEVGGLWGEVNEKATVAFAAGATEIGALDIWKEDSEWWQRFRNRCAAFGLKGVKETIGSIDNVDVIGRVGVYDIVHCSGVLYHCPNPFLTLSHLRQLTSEYFLLATAVMPPLIENSEGRVEFGADSALLVPCLTDERRGVVSKYITQAYGGGAYGVHTPIDDWFFRGDEPNYGPWWWLWTGRLCRAHGEGLRFQGREERLAVRWHRPPVPVEQVAPDPRKLRDLLIRGQAMPG